MMLQFCLQEFFDNAAYVPASDIPVSQSANMQLCLYRPLLDLITYLFHIAL